MLKVDDKNENLCYGVYLKFENLATKLRNFIGTIWIIEKKIVFLLKWDFIFIQLIENH